MLAAASVRSDEFPTLWAASVCVWARRVRIGLGTFGLHCRIDEMQRYGDDQAG